ncbi:FecR family protein [Spirosoma luteolum]
MSQHEFDELLQKYLAGQCTPQEEQLILAWYDDMTRDESVWLPLENTARTAMRHRIWQRLARHLPLVGETPDSRRRWMPMAWVTAACLTLAIGTSVWLQVDNRAGGAARLSGQVQTIQSDQKPRSVQLSDGTVVVLKPCARLTYPARFGANQRVVSLTGEAYFSVKRDPARPFIVHAGELITEVLGTSFTVKSMPNVHDVEVAVMTGRVSVYKAADRAKADRQEVVLKPNERIAWSAGNRQLVPTLVEQPVPVAAARTPVSFVFSETPLPAVLNRLQASYGIDIVVESDALSGCLLSADLNDLPLYSQLELICKSINADYEVRGTSIIIKGKGCSA